MATRSDPSRRRNAAGALLSILVLSAPAVATPRSDWLPAEIERALAAQLAGRLAALGRADVPAETFERPAAAAVATIVDVVGGWSATDLRRRAPELAALDVPALPDPDLDAAQRYQICNGLLLRQLEHEDFAADLDARFTAALGLSAVTAATLRLQRSFVDRGGDPAQVEAALTRPELEPAFEAFQRDADLRTHVEEQCGPIVLELALPAARSFGESAPAP